MLIYSLAFKHPTLHLTLLPQSPPESCGPGDPLGMLKEIDSFSITAYTVIRDIALPRRTRKLSPCSKFVENLGCSRNLLESLHHEESSLNWCIPEDTHFTR